MLDRHNGRVYARPDASAADAGATDAPFVHTRPAGAEASRPCAPGASLRGPLRHAASRLARLGDPDAAVRDPNWRWDPEARRLEDELRAAEADPARRATAEWVRGLVDPLTRWFGAEELAAQVLVSDARVTGGFELVRLEHHAEDEFTAGVYRTAKFDREVLTRGRLEFKLVVELEPEERSGQSLAQGLESARRALAPALHLARAGHLPVGGGKWRGTGWIPWSVKEVALERVGEARPAAPGDPDPFHYVGSWRELQAPEQEERRA